MLQTKLPSGEKLFQKVLGNGLAVFILPKPGFLRTYGVLSTHYGAIDYRFRLSNQEAVEMPPGIAHFLEHKLFEEDGGNVFTDFARMGASVNAFTSHTQTSYLFSTVECWEEALIRLIEFVNRPYLTEENVEKEKSIIEQELRMYEDHPQQRVLSTLLENLYYENPVRLDIGGTVESVREITVEQLLYCYRAFYQPSNMGLAVVGDVKPERVLELADKHYPEWQHFNGPIQRIYPTEPRGVVQDWVEEELDISRPRYLLGFKHNPGGTGRDMLRRQIVMSLVWRLAAAPSSRFYSELYEEGLISDSFGASFSGHPRFAYSVIGSETDEPERLHERLAALINQLKQGAAAADVERLKRQLYGGHLASYDSFEYAANRFISYYFYQVPYQDFLKILDSVTAEEVCEAAIENLDWECSSVSVLRVRR